MIALHPQNHLIEPVVVPRFASTCSQPLLNALGDLASEMDVPVHSHICQQKEEVTKILFNNPSQRDTASIFDAAGMLNSKVRIDNCVCLTKYRNLKDYVLLVMANKPLKLLVVHTYMCVHCTCTCVHTPVHVHVTCTRIAVLTCVHDTTGRLILELWSMWV